MLGLGLLCRLVALAEGSWCAGQPAKAKESQLGEGVARDSPQESESPSRGPRRVHQPEAVPIAQCDLVATTKCKCSEERGQPQQEGAGRCEDGSCRGRGEEEDGRPGGEES